MNYHNSHFSSSYGFSFGFTPGAIGTKTGLYGNPFKLKIRLPRFSFSMDHLGYEYTGNRMDSGFPEMADISWIHRPIDDIYGTVNSGSGADVSRGAVPDYLRRCGMCHNPEGQYYDQFEGWRKAFWMNVVGIMGAAVIGLMFATLPAKAVRTGTSAARLSSNGYKLNRHLYQLEKYGSGGFRTLQNGRFRYYGRSTLNRGNQNSFRMVREWNPYNGYTRNWFETLNPNGSVIQVRPEFGTGMKTHYLFDDFGRYLGTW